MQTKADIRKRVIAARDALAVDVRAEKSARICAELTRLLDERFSLADRPTIALFAAMGSEVDLRAFALAALERGARVAYPCMVKNPAWPSAAVESPDAATPAPFVPRQLMEFRLVTREQLDRDEAVFVTRPLRSFAPNDPELAAFPPIEPAQFDFAVCPLVAFDEEGHRLGYGGGNYDAFLPQLRVDALVLGVAFAEQCVPCGTIPLEPHDLPLPRIVSA